MALIPPQYLNAVVSIELGKSNKSEKENTTIATGFLYGKLISKNKKENTSTYRIFLLTNRHVFQDDNGQLLEKVLLRFNLTEKRGTKCYEINLVENKEPRWIMHKDKKVDLALMPLNAQAMEKESIDFYYFREDTDIYFAKDFETKGVSTGDGVFILGFPLGLRGNSKNYAIVKSGIISRVDDEILKKKTFLIDSSVYPGNSGGPVIYKPEILSIQGTKSISRAGLIGVISSGITYQETAYSRQTNRPRIVFEEQTGIVRVVPIDLVNEAIRQYNRSKGKPKNNESLKANNPGN